MDNQSESPPSRTTILSSFLRGRPRNASTSQPHVPTLNIDQSHPFFPQRDLSPVPTPVSPRHQHRRSIVLPIPVASSTSTAANPSSANTSPYPPSSVPNTQGLGFTNMLRRRRSAGTVVPPPTAPTQPTPNTDIPPNLRQTHRIRIVPHIDSRRSLRFDPITRDLSPLDSPLRIGRFTDRSGLGISSALLASSNKVAFRSKVVSRSHAEISVSTEGKFYLKDTKSSSGTFLNHVRLSAANQESKNTQIKDGDVVQFGVDYQGGAEEIYKSVKVRIEIGPRMQLNNLELYQLWLPQVKGGRRKSRNRVYPIAVSVSLPLFFFSLCRSLDMTTHSPCASEMWRPCPSLHSSRPSSTSCSARTLRGVGYTPWVDFRVEPCAVTFVVFYLFDEKRRREGELSPSTLRGKGKGGDRPRHSAPCCVICTGERKRRARPVLAFASTSYSAIKVSVSSMRRRGWWITSRLFSLIIPSSFISHTNTTPTGLFGVTIQQALFVAPCSHAFHFKCIRPLLEQHHPAFNCPLCRTYADLNADVEIDQELEDETSEEECEEENGKGGETEVEGDGIRRTVLPARTSPSVEEVEEVLGEEDLLLDVDEGEEDVLMFDSDEGMGHLVPPASAIVSEMGEGVFVDADATVGEKRKR
ncbi:hypothetical protein BDQ17DRAFT_531844 [Cyathus striatus]|nr:hypothetical protein BDQ17DRAFT_531844 [Cyathus striatus]